MFVFGGKAEVGLCAYDLRYGGGKADVGEGQSISGHCQTNAIQVAIAFLACSRKVKKTCDIPQSFGD